MGLTLAAPPRSEAASGKMTQYRVYQNEKPLKEFASQSEAVYYAKQFRYSHVEQIAGRQWVWDNFPRYKVYVNGASEAAWEFGTYADALALAKSQKNVHIRDLQSTGWSYSSYAAYRLYQGDITLPDWNYVTLEEAKKEAKKWSNAHVIELATGKWIWDNLTPEQAAAQSAAEPLYQVTVNGQAAESIGPISFLKNGIAAAENLPGSQLINLKSGAVVHSTIPGYEVRQNGKLVKAFRGLPEAVKLAVTLANTEVLNDGKVLWSSYPYLQVFQGDRKINSFHKLASALSYATYYANASIVTLEGRKLWTNVKPLVVLGWNGSSASATIQSHVAGTQGLDMDSPTWFQLTDANGGLEDTSNPATVAMLKERGILTVPLVHNQFDRAMTSQFLKNKEAQTVFIDALVGRLSELGVYGVNLDFEEVAGADRAAYTAFVKALTSAAHAKKLKVSIDLPRGSISWNHLTAYDHAALSSIVDTVIIMAYDEHWRGSDKPGSVAGLAWAEEGVKQFLDYGVPRSKLMLGIPFYVREWRLDASGRMVDNRAIFMKEIPRLIQENNATGVYHAESGQWKYTYQKDGYTHVFWAETHETVLARIAIAKKYDLAGVAAWRLGYEDAELWTKILRSKS
ncbi:glycosyl hydrolase family 18 protein [Paenibacillus sp. CAU 1782]